LTAEIPLATIEEGLEDEMRYITSTIKISTRDFRKYRLVPILFIGRLISFTYLERLEI
jgi:hypothetical protein